MQQEIKVSSVTACDVRNKKSNRAVLRFRYSRDVMTYLEVKACRRFEITNIKKKSVDHTSMGCFLLLVYAGYYNTCMFLSEGNNFR